MAIAALVSANPSYRVLIITYRVVLATKMCEELNRDSDLDFKVYYEEERGELIAGRLVAQIDSIARVEMSAFDMVVVDEAGSAVGHTCSALIVDPVRVMQCLQFHLAKAGRVILLDACMDDFPGYRLVQCIERLKGVSARWIHNGFVRAPGFTATLHICRASDGTTQAAFKDSAIDAILAYIDEGRRIFVPSSSKAFAVAVHMSIERHCVEREVDPPRVLLITADTSDEVKKATSKDFNAALSAVDVFICSPAIIAGSSFTVPDHFTPGGRWCRWPYKSVKHQICKPFTCACRPIGTPTSSSCRAASPLPPGTLGSTPHLTTLTQTAWPTSVSVGSSTCASRAWRTTLVSCAR